MVTTHPEMKISAAPTDDTFQVITIYPGEAPQRKNVAEELGAPVTRFLSYALGNNSRAR